MTNIFRRAVFAFLALIAALSSAVGQVRSELNIAYSTNALSLQHLDLFTPPTRDYPTVLFIHGGSLTSGDKSDAPAAVLCDRLVLEGIACASANYRLLNGAARWPEPAQDAAAAFAWLVRNIAQRGGDARRIFILGHSSGCHLGTLIATDSRYLAAQSPPLAPRDIAGVFALGCRLDNSVDSASAGERIVQFYSNIFGSLSAANDAVPLRHVNAAMSPIVVLMGENEQINPPILADGQRFAEAALKVGKKVPVHVIPARTHITALSKMGDANDPALKIVLEAIRGR